MKITITLTTDNAAFEDQDETPRILRDLVCRLSDNPELLRDSKIPLFDWNGNKVGDCEIQP